MSTDQPTEEQMGYAYVFLNALKSDKKMAQEWKQRLKNVNDPKFKIKDKISYLDNFLADNGFNTTAQAVLTLLKTPWWNDYIKSRQPNKQSDRFVQDVLQDTHLYAEWGQAIQKSTEAGNLDKVNAFLKDQGYDCTATQVNASFQKMRDQNLNYWTGTYGQTSLQADGETKGQLGPSLIVYGDSNVSVGADKLFNFKYENGVLSWTTEGGGSIINQNQSSGKITFSQIWLPKSNDAYVGDIFGGNITYPKDSDCAWKGTYNYSGRVGSIPKNEEGKIYAPPSVNQDEVHKIAAAIAPYALFGFIIMAVGGLVWKVGKFIKERFGNKIKEDAKEAADQTAKQDAEVPQGSNFSESTTVEQLNKAMEQTSDPARQEELKNEIAETKERQAKTQEQEEEDVTEDGEQATELEEAGVL